MTLFLKKNSKITTITCMTIFILILVIGTGLFRIISAAPQDLFLTFDGGDDYVYFPTTANVAEGSAITVGAWIKPAVNTGNMVIASKTRSGFTQWNLRRVSSTSKISFEVKNAAGITVSVATTNPVGTDLAWHYVIATYDVANLAIYVDGVLASSLVPQTGAMFNYDYPICIGSNALNASSCLGGSYMNGSLDSVIILSTADVVLAESFVNPDPFGRPTLFPTQVIGFWEMDEGSGQVLDFGSLDGQLGSTSGVDANDPVWGFGPLFDAEAPQVNITAPSDNSTVSGSSVIVSANATDDIGVAGVLFSVLVGGSVVDIGVEDTLAPFNVTWNSTGVPNGSYSVTATARDAVGNTMDFSINVTVSNFVDSQPPSVPTGLSAVAVSPNAINLTWNSSTDNVGVTGYRIYRGGVEIATSATNSYSNVSLAPSTSYVYTVAAYDALNNLSAQSTSANATTLAPTPTPSLTPTPTPAPGDWVPPIGIPAPSFGINEPIPDTAAKCLNWP